MTPLDALWHLLNFVYPALAMGCISAALAKLAWPQALRSRPWLRLARDVALACLAVLVAGLVAFGHDGKMATYLGMVAATAVTLGWRGGLWR